MEQEKLLQRVFTTFDVRAEVKSHETKLQEIRRGLEENEKLMLRLFASETASERKATSDRGNTVTAETLWHKQSSTVKMDGDNKTLTARCRWNRSVSVSAECQETRKDFIVSRRLSEQGDTNGRSLE